MTRLFQACVDVDPILGLERAVLEGFPRQEEASQGCMPTKMGEGSTFGGHAMTRNSLFLTPIGYQTATHRTTETTKLGFGPIMPTPSVCCVFPWLPPLSLSLSLPRSPSSVLSPSFLSVSFFLSNQYI